MQNLLTKIMVIISIFIGLNTTSLAIVTGAHDLHTPPAFQQAMKVWTPQGLGIKNFKQWIFHRGTLFAAGSIWWPSRHHYQRPVPHEGVDFYYYQQKNQQTVDHLQALRPVPLIYPGTLIATFKDFIGHTYIFTTDLTNTEGDHFFILYAHMRPIVDPATEVGKHFARGAKLFTINTPQKTMAPSHLHLSTFWETKPIKASLLSWETLDKNPNIILVNPLYNT